MGHMDPTSAGNDLSEALLLLVERYAGFGLPAGGYPAIGNGPQRRICACFMSL
jgi:hypothetical protein